MNCNRLFFKILFFLLYTHFTFAFQENVNTIDSNNSYRFLSDAFNANEKDTVQAKKYANRYVVKAKKDNDTINLIYGFYFMSLISEYDISHKYSDSIIKITKNNSSAEFPIYSYFHKAGLYFKNGDFKQAFDYFLIVNEEAIKHGNIGLKYASKKNIGILKAVLGENETALINLRDCYSFFSKHRKDEPGEYLDLLFALSESYNLNKVLDSASMMNHLGYKESIILERKEFQYFFILNEGINHFSKENYLAANDSLVKAVALMEKNGDLTNLGQAHYYLGKSLSAIGREGEAIEAHKKVDSIFQITPQIIPESRKSYEVLINHYQRINDRDNQLKYIERLLRVDSVLNSNYKYLIKNVVQNYDTPRLLSEKQEIIDSLEKGKKSSVFWIALLAILCIISVIFLVYNYVRKRIYKRRFDELFQVSGVEKRVVDVIINQEEAIGIDEVIVKDILDKLVVFENDLSFLKRNITTNSLAKNFDTNSKYLSKVINTYKKKNFNTYINELRIDYSIKRLKTDRKFKNYSIRAIAQEMGYNSAEVFSKAFFKKNGIHPSYFIKQLDKQEQQ